MQRLGERDGEAAADDVLGRGDEAAGDRLADERLERRLAREVERRRAVLRRDAGEARVGAARRGPASPSPTSTTASPSATNAGPTSVATSSSRPTTPISGVGAIAPAGRLVVERDVAAGDRQAERAAGVAEPADRLA